MQIKKENEGPKPRKVTGGRITAVSTVHYPMNGKPYSIRKGLKKGSFTHTNNEIEDLSEMDQTALLKEIDGLLDKRLSQQAVNKSTEAGSEAAEETTTEAVKKELTPEDHEVIKAMIDEAITPLKTEIESLKTEIEGLKTATDTAKGEADEVKASIVETEKSYNQTMKSMKELIQKALDATPEGNQTPAGKETPVKKEAGSGHVMRNSPIHAILVQHGRSK